MFKERPKINLKLTLIDWVLEAICLLSIVGIWLLTLVYYRELPEIIPIHYNLTGDVDGFGRKVNLLSLPSISTIIYLGLTILNKYPHTFNYPKSFTKENVREMYRATSRIMRLLKLVSTLIFGMIILETIQTVNGNSDELKIWFTFSPFIFSLIPLIYILYFAKNKTK